MAPSKKRDKFKDWLSGFFPAKGGIRYTPDGPQRSTGVGGFFDHAQDFTLHNPTLTSVHGDHIMVDNTITYIHGDRNIAPQIMGLLSQHIIRGAAHDSSARTPPPRCHPGTRVKLIGRITAWLDGQGLPELVLWITGPAGVGKSAIVQTFAERLVKLKLLGASVFFSRISKRNNPHGVFITIAYQLATRIEAYRDFVVERLSLDPELLNGDVQTQFEVFVVEPFVEKKIGVGGKRWGILLDGLDEVQGQDPQCEIIRLISTFVHEHRDAPLVWIIASRPELHISNMFNDDEVRRNCWSEYLPIDSTESCNDVECFFRASFKTIQKKFQTSVPDDWPNDTDFLKLTAAASGLFVYAEVVMQFIRDPDHADPISRLEVLLSVIDRSSDASTKENPFVHLDALYHEILSSIPSNLWPTAKRLLGFVGGQGTISSTCRVGQLGTLRGMSIPFGLSPHAIYSCIIKCYSTLRVPDWKVAHKETLGILHASFSDYLKDSSRSGEFHIGSNEAIDHDIQSNLLEIWSKCSEGNIGTVEIAWDRYCMKWEGTSPSRAITKFHADLLSHVVLWLTWMIYQTLRKQPVSPIYAPLHQVHMIKISYYFLADNLREVVGALAETMLNDTRLLRRIYLKDLKFDHLDWSIMSPARAHFGTSGVFSDKQWILHRPRSRAVLEAFVSELESLQESSPELEIVVFGGVPEGRIAAFRHDFKYYYVLPYPE